MSPKATGYAELYAANVADDHYHQRRNATKSIALRSAECALEVAQDNTKLMTRLYDRGLATSDDLLMAVDAELLVKHLRDLLNDFWFIERQTKAMELEAFTRGELGYTLKEGVFAPHSIEVQS